MKKSLLDRDFDIAYMQSECLLKYSHLTHKPTTECAGLFKKYNLFTYISECYDILHLEGVDYLVRDDIANRINKGICYQAS